MTETNKGIYTVEDWQTQPCATEAVTSIEMLRGVLANIRALILAADPPPTCTWRYDDDTDDGFWSTDCGAEWWFEDGGPAENEMNFCTKCGKILKVGIGPESSQIDYDEL